MITNIKRYQPALSLLTAALLSTCVYQTSHAFSTPAVTVMATQGSYFNGWGDALIPLKESNNRLFYTDAQAQGGSSNASMYSLGGGYRQADGKYSVLGAYLFADRERSGEGEYFTVVSPGVEKLTPTWNYRLNTYFPVGNKKQRVSSGWASDYGIYDYQSFTGHSEYDKSAEEYQQLSYGGDVTIGYRFAQYPDIEIDVSPYAYRMVDDNAMLGGKVQLNLYHKRNTSVFIGDGYDNKNKNRVFVGVSMNLGARNNGVTQDDLMLSPVYRNLDVNTTQDGIPVNNYVQVGDSTELVENNIYFIDNTSTTGTEDGTYENPYTDIDDINSVSNSSAHFWVANTGTAYNTSSLLVLDGTQTLEGRSSDYRTANTLGSLTTIYAPTIDVEGNNTISGIRLYNNGSVDEGVDVDNNDSVVLDNVVIGALNDNGGYGTGLYLQDDSTAVVRNSTIFGYYPFSNSANNDAYAIYTDDDTNLTVRNTTLSAQAMGQSQEAYGIWADDSVIDVANTTVNATAGEFASGISIGTSTLTLDNSIINSTSDEDGNAVELYYNRGNTKITNSVFNVNAAEKGDGVYVYSGTGTISIDNNYFNISGDDQARGVASAFSNSLIDVTNNNFVISSSATNGTSYGIYDSNGSVTYSDNQYELSGSSKKDVEN